MATIVDFADLKVMLDLEKDVFADYPDLELIADEVHAALENFTGRKLNTISKATETGVLVDSKYINLFNLPITSIESVAIDSVAVDFEITPYGVGFTAEYSGPYSITSKGGFKTIPEDVYRAELSQIVYEYQNKNNMAATNFTNDGGSVSLPGFVLLTQVKNILWPYMSVDKLGY